MTTSSLTIRPPQSADELREHLDGYVEAAPSFSPDPLPRGMADRLLRRLTTLPNYRPAQVRGA